MTGPYYQDDTITVHHGDCLNVLRTLPDNSVDSVVTDPPYSLNFMGKSWDEHAGTDDAALGYWLAGFIDGEGCFTVKGHARGTFAPSFALKVRRDDRAALVQAQRFVGGGQIQDVDDAAGNSRPQVRWAIQDRDGCQRLVDVLDKYPLRAKKRLDYLSWREAVCEWTDRPRGNRWAGAADQTRMGALRQRTADVKVYVDPPWSGHEFQDWCRLWATECLRVLRPGGHLVAFGGTRTAHRLTCAIEDAGFEIRDSIAWVHAQGFAKSWNFDTMYSGEWCSCTPGDTAPREGGACPRCGGLDQAFRGFGSAAKPAHEPVTVARKPLQGNVAQNVLTWGTGALNINAGRIGTTERPVMVRTETVVSASSMSGESTGATASGETTTLGRWPANVAFDGHTAALLDQQSGIQRDGFHVGRNRDSDATANAILNPRRKDVTDGGYGGEGGASRFFFVSRDDPDPAFIYTAKADSSERPRIPGAGDSVDMGRSKRCQKCGKQRVNAGTSSCSCPEPEWVNETRDYTAHPTVKPLDLMRHLARIFTPPGGTILEPFAGSGTTVEAAIIEGFHCIAIEKEAEYLPLIELRVTRQRDPVRAIELAGDDLGLFDFGDDA